MSGPLEQLAEIINATDTEEEAAEAIGKWYAEEIRKAKEEGFNRAINVMVWEDGTPIEVVAVFNPYTLMDGDH